MTSCRWRTAVRFVVWSIVLSSAPLTAGDEQAQGARQSCSDGFVSMFDGKSLAGWHAAPKDCASDWTVESGAIVGRGSVDRLAYLVWKEERLTDFELELRYRLPGKGNTGIEIRSQSDPGGKRPFQGYHADLGHVGIGPHILGAWDFHFSRRTEHPCPRGTRLVIDDTGRCQSQLLENALTVKDIRPHDWNDVRIVARGRQFRFYINGKLASEFTDNAKEGRLDDGAIGLQIHDKGMTVEFKDLRLKRLSASVAAPDEKKDLGLQLAENPPMRIIATSPPAPAPVTEEFEIRDGFTLISTLDEFRATIQKDRQRVRMKPGLYQAVEPDPPQLGQEHIFAVNGSNNHFDLRGVVIETPVSVQSKLTSKAHVADCWHVNGSGNTFEGGYFRNVVNRAYPHYHVTENEFEVLGDGNTWLNCTFFIKGSVPFGYSDYYGKGGPNFGRLNKHSFFSIFRAKDTKLIGCRVYLHSFGHCVHFHGADGVLIKDCHFSGALRPTNDIFEEQVGRAREYDFHIMFRGKRPIPHDQMIPLTEDGVRSYGGDRNITVVDTTVERMRGCFQLLCDGDVTLENVTVLEAGDFGFDVSSGDKGNVVMKNCRADLAYNPLFNLTRGAVPKSGFFDVTILSPAEEVNPTARTSLGAICGDDCTFILRDGTTRPLPDNVNRLVCGGKKPLVNSTVTNYTTATLILTESVRNCVIQSAGRVEDHGTQNTVVDLSR